MAVKQAVQAVLSEVLTNRELQEQLQRAAKQSSPPEETHGKQSMANRLWQAATEAVRRTVQKVKQFGRGVGRAGLGTRPVRARRLLRRGRRRLLLRGAHGRRGRRHRAPRHRDDLRPRARRLFHEE